MIRIENVAVVGLSKVITVRRSFGSLEDSDSYTVTRFSESQGDLNKLCTYGETVEMGEKDLKLMSKLTQNGDSHAKTNRFVTVYLDLTLPRRVWVDMDTYRLGCDYMQPDDIEYMSDSTMHTIKDRFLNGDDFDKYTPIESINIVNARISAYKLDETEFNFLAIKSSLPEGFLQTRSLKTNYQALRHIYFDRFKHKQPEFRKLCDWIKTLPYAEELILSCK